MICVTGRRALTTGFGFGDFVKQDIKFSSTGPLIIPGKIPVGLGPVHPMTYLITASTPADKLP